MYFPLQDADYRKMLLKNSKTRRKRKIEPETLPSSSKNDAKEVPEEKRTKGPIDVETRDVDVMEMESNEDSDEDCAAKPCRQPTGMKNICDLLFVIIKG